MRSAPDIADCSSVYRAERSRIGTKNMSMYATKANKVPNEICCFRLFTPAYQSTAAIQTLETISMAASSVASSTMERLLALR